MTTKCVIFIWSCKHTFKVELCCHKSSRVTCQNCLLFLQWQKWLELQLILFVALQSALSQSRGKCLLQQNGRHFWQQKLFSAFVKTNKIVDPNLFCSTQWQNLCQRKHALCNDKMLLQQLLNCGSSHQWHPCQTYLPKVASKEMSLPLAWLWPSCAATAKCLKLFPPVRIIYSWSNLCDMAETKSYPLKLVCR